MQWKETQHHWGGEHCGNLIWHGCPKPDQHQSWNPQQFQQANWTTVHLPDVIHLLPSSFNKYPGDTLCQILLGHKQSNLCNTSWFLLCLILGIPCSITEFLPQKEYWGDIKPCHKYKVVTTACTQSSLKKSTYWKAFSQWQGVSVNAHVASRCGT